MTDNDSTVNSQITDSVVQVHSATASHGPAETFAILDLVMTETVGMGMHNAVNAQQSMQMMASAAITATCARMINGQEPVAQAGKDPDGSSGPVVSTSPLSPEDPSTIIQAAQKEAQKAAGTLSRAALMAKQTVEEAKTALTQLGASSADSDAGDSGSQSDSDATGDDSSSGSS